MPHDPLRLREETLSRVADLGFPRPPAHFPVLWEAGEDYSIRTPGELARRAAVLDVVIARTFGMPPELGLPWIEREGLSTELSPSERDFLVEDDGVAPEIQVQIEALQALAWALGVGEHLDPTRYCDDTLVQVLPDLRVGQPFEGWRANLPPARNADDVMGALDLYYCLTWGLADANLTRKQPPGEVDPYVVWQRRRALEWMVLRPEPDEEWQSEWDDIDLST